jgi:hypothetical protein
MSVVPDVPQRRQRIKHGCQHKEVEAEVEDVEIFHHRTNHHPRQQVQKLTSNYRV